MFNRIFQLKLNSDDGFWILYEHSGVPVKNLFVFLVIVHPVITNLWFCYLPKLFILPESNIRVVPLPHAMPKSLLSRW